MITNLVIIQNFFWGMLNSIMYAGICTLYVLMARRAGKSGGAALHWIVPTLTGFGLFLFGSLFNALFWMGRFINPTPPVMGLSPGYFSLLRITYRAAIALVAYGAFRQWQAMQHTDETTPPVETMTPANRQEGVWPPPPSR